MVVDSKDWRFDNLESFSGETFRFSEYHTPSQEWDHDHCVGCWAKFAEYEAPYVIHQGYVHAQPYEERQQTEFITKCEEQGMRVLRQPAVEGSQSSWVCSACFEDFRELLNFILEP